MTARVRIRMPRIADTTDDYVVDEWCVEPGNAFTQGDPLLYVETDKAVAPVPAPLSGHLIQQLVKRGEEIVTGQAVAVIEVSDANPTA